MHQVRFLYPALGPTMTDLESAPPLLAEALSVWQAESTRLGRRPTIAETRIGPFEPLIPSLAVIEVDHDRADLFLRHVGAVINERYGYGELTGQWLSALIQPEELPPLWHGIRHILASDQPSRIRGRFERPPPWDSYNHDSMVLPLSAMQGRREAVVSAVHYDGS